MPPDEGDVEVLWHRASGRASTPPPVSPPRHRDAYSPSRPRPSPRPPRRAPRPPMSWTSSLRSCP